jgi:NADPH-dependent curcumin reductase CurA
MAELSREIRLAARPVGFPKDTDFELTETRVPDPRKGEVLVRNLYMSVDPYMRGRMNEGRSYAAPFEIGEPLHGAAVGQVVQTNHPEFAEGTFVLNVSGWRESFLSDGAGLRKVDPDLAPLSAYLGVLGMPGLTAYVGLLDIGQAREGEIVFVSTAAGAVGSVVGQIAKLKGCRVLGSAGSDAKVELLRSELGFDAAFNYKAIPPRRALADLAPDGIDIYFDNVGGDHLEAALYYMRPFGRIPVCGMISLYNATELPPGPRNLGLVIPRRLAIRGFLVGDHLDRLTDFERDMSRWLADGRMRSKETIVEGIELAPRAFLAMLQGENVGKMVVRLAPESSRGGRSEPPPKRGRTA